MSTRLALLFGTGAVSLQRIERVADHSKQLGRVRTVRVLGDIEFAEDDDRFIS